MVLDNLREGVLSPDIYDPTLNPFYRDVLPHTSLVAMPVASVIRIEKAKSNPASDTPRKPRSRISASKA